MITQLKTLFRNVLVSYFTVFTMTATAQTEDKVLTPDTRLTIPAIGRVVASNEVNITNITDGRVLWLAEAGDRVEKGQVLVKLDNPKLSLDLKVQNAEKEKLEQKIIFLNKQVSKSRLLYDTNGLSLNDLDELEHDAKLQAINLRIVNAKRELLLHDINELTIKAPFDGVVTERFASQGFYALKNQSLLTFISQDAQELDILVSNQYLSKINDQVGINFTSRFGVISGSLKTIIPTVDPDNSMFHIRTILPDNPWINGEKMRVEIQIVN